MDYLLNTHIVLWWLDNSSKLSEDVKEIITDPTNRIIISVASFWEINIKRSIGKLTIQADYAKYLTDDFDIRAIELTHVMGINELPDLHKDPFDRLIIALAVAEKLTLITEDHKFKDYPVMLYNELG
jgi:PIN domain nuclease of toxin-antitoxin system